MHPKALAERVAALPVPTEVDHFPLDRLAGNLHLSRSAGGDPCLVLTYNPEMRLPAGRRTEGMHLDFHNSFAVTMDGESITHRCAVLRSISPDLHYYFFVLVGGLLEKLTEAPHLLEAPSTLLTYVEEWQHLLLSRRAYTLQEEIGLWGELAFILACSDADGAVAAWRGPLRKVYDFAAPGLEIDVKTSLQGHLHHFRLEQLQPSPSEGRRLIYSIRAVDDPSGGTTVDELVQRIRAKMLDPGPFEVLLLKALYKEGQARSIRLTALERLLVRVEEVPSVTAMPGVSQVHFQSDLRFSSPHTEETINGVLEALVLKGEVE